MARDYYDEALDIARSLEDEGLSAEAQTLREAIDRGSTGTEILMALRFRLKHIYEAGLLRGGKTKDQIRDLAAAISAALGEM